MSEQRIIAFAGPIGSGKNYAAKQLPPKYKEFSFAEPLKEGCMLQGGFTHDEVYVNKDVVAKNGLFPRAILQQVGAVYIQHDPSHFANLLLRKIKDEPYVVITDLRFGKEAGMLWDIGATLIRIENPLKPNQSTDATELQQFPVDVTVMNHETPEFGILINMIETKKFPPIIFVGHPGSGVEYAQGLSDGFTSEVYMNKIVVGIETKELPFQDHPVHMKVFNDGTDQFKKSLLKLFS